MMTLIPLLLFCCQSVAPSGGTTPVGAADGTTWTDGTTTIVLSVGDNPNGGVYTNLIDSAGFSQPVNSSQGGDTATGGVTSYNSQGMNAPGGSGTYRVVNGKLCKRNARGKWVPLRKVKTPKQQQKQKTGGSLAPTFLHTGDVAPFKGKLSSPFYRGVILDRGEQAPFDGQLVPSDDITGLPG